MVFHLDFIAKKAQTALLLNKDVQGHTALINVFGQRPPNSVNKGNIAVPVTICITSRHHGRGVNMDVSPQARMNPSSPGGYVILRGDLARRSRPCGFEGQT